MLDNVAIPAVRQNRSKLAPTSCQASSTIAPVPMAADVLIFFMALLSFVGFDTPSLTGSRRATPTSQFQQQPGHPPSAGQPVEENEMNEHSVTLRGKER